MSPFDHLVPPDDVTQAGRDWMKAFELDEDQARGEWYEVGTVLTDEGEPGQRAEASRPETAPADDGAVEPATSPTDAGALQETERRPSGWDAPGVVDHPERPDLEAVRLSDEKREHILQRHRSGSGRPGKTEFPPDWDDDKIASLVEDVARNPDEVPRMQSNGRWVTRGVREGVIVVAVLEPSGDIVTGYPKAGGPGVVRNR